MARVRSLLAVIASASLMVACSGSDGRTGSTTAVSMSALPLGPAPLGAYLDRSAHDRYVFARAEHGFIGRCMVGKGFRFDEPEPRLETFRSNRYGELDPVVISEHGYHLPPEQQPPESFVPMMSDDERGRYFEVRNGVPGEDTQAIEDDAGAIVEYDRGGCLGEWDQYVFEGFENYESVRLTLDRWQSESLATALASPAVEAAVARWQDCMRAQGYRYDVVAEPAREFGGTPTITPEELQVAAADARCRLDADYATTLAREDHRAQQQFVDTDPTVVARYAQVWDAALRAAASLEITE